SRLPASIAAIGVLPLELAWNADVVTGGRLIGLAAYMFDKRLSPGLRALSLFHVALPPTLLWLLRRLGYDRRAFAIQCGLTAIVLPLSYAASEPKDNINWVFGPGSHPQRRLPPLLYLGLVMLALPLLVRGLYYDQWHSPSAVHKERHQEEFLARVQEGLRDTRPVNVQEAVRTVFAVLAKHIAKGQADKTARVLPAEIRALWPTTAD